MQLRLSKSLRHSLKDSAYYSAMVGFGETYIAAFVLAAGYGALHSGLISIVPITIGSLLQIPYLKYFSHRTGYKKWVTLFCLMQSFALTVLAVMALFAKVPITLIYTFVAIYWASGLISSVGWNSWMSEYIPTRLRIKFFSRRARIGQLFVFLGIFSAGIMLQFSSSIPHANEYKFALLFLIAGLFRVASTYHISQQTEVPPTTSKSAWKFNHAFIENLRQKDIIKIILYVFCLHSTVNLAAPYFNPYMLQNMQLNYFEYVFVVSFTYLTRISCMNIFSRFSSSLGSFHSIFIGTVLISLPPFFWTVSHNLYFIAGLQIISGIGWGLQDLGLSVLLIEKFKSNFRPQAFAIINSLSSFGMIFGSLIGGFTLQHYAFSDQAYVYVFGASTLLRLLVAISLLSMEKVSIKDKVPVYWRIIAVRPTWGVILRPIFINGRRKHLKKGPFLPPD